MADEIIKPEDCEFGYNFKPFSCTGLFPLRDTKTDHIVKRIEKHQGHFYTGLVPGPSGPPFGAHRIIPITLAIKAYTERTRKIEFESWNELLAPLGLAETGRNYRYLHDGVNRIGEARYWFGHLQNIDGNWRDEREYWEFIKGHTQWYDENMKPLERPPRGEKFCLTLSEEFFDDIRRGVRINLTLLKHLTHSWGSFDLALWLGPRAQAVPKGTNVAVSLYGSDGLVNQLAVKDDIPEKEFRRQLDRWMQTVAPVWEMITCHRFPLRWASHKKSLLISHDEIIPPHLLRLL